MGAAPSIALAPLGMGAAAISLSFNAGWVLGAALGGTSAAASNALDAVYDAAEAVIEYLRKVKDAACSAYEGVKRSASSAYEGTKSAAASFYEGVKRSASSASAKSAAASAYEGAKKAAAWAYEKVVKAAMALKDRVLKLVRSFGHRRAAAAKRKMDSAAEHAASDVFTKASALVAPSLVWSWSLGCSSPPPGALALTESVSDAARLAFTSTDKMMALLETFVPLEAKLGASIPTVARSSIAVIAAAAGICLEVFSPTADAVAAAARHF